MMQNQLPKLDIESALIEVGFDPIDFGDHYRVRAIYRDGSNSTSIAVYKDNGTWNDYGTGLLGQPFSKLIELTGKKLSGELDIFEGGSERVVDRNEDAEFKYKPSVLKKLFPHHKFYEDKGISKELIQNFRGGLATEGKMYQRYVFPIFDENDMVIGFSGRNMSSSNRVKWKHLGKKTSWEYPYYFKVDDEYVVQKDIRETGNVVLVESIGDVLSYFNNEKYNCLCAFGLSISSKITSLLVRENPKTIFISFNNDQLSKNNSGLIGAIKTYSKLLEFFDHSRIKICLPVKNDFGDMDEQDFIKWREKKAYIESFNNQIVMVLKLAKKFKEDGLVSDNIVKNIKKYEK